MNYLKDNTCLFSYGEKLRVVWEITHNCNYACKHCCVNAIRSQLKELSKEKIFTGIDNLVDFGLESIYFSGGEPLMKEGIFEILEYTGKKIPSKNITIATNGKIVNKEIAKKLADLEIGSVLVSLDGHNSETAKAFRKVDETFDFAVSAVKLLTKYNIKVRLGVVVWNGNINHLEEFVKLGIELGVDNVFFGWLVPVGPTSVRNLKVDNNLFFNVASQLKSLKEKYLDIIKVTYHRFEEIDDSCNFCKAGKKLLHLLPNGNVTPCSWLYKVDNNFCSNKRIFEESLKNILKEDFLQDLDLLLKKREEKNLGPGCPAMCKAFVNNFDVLDPVYNGIYGKGIFYKQNENK